MILFHAMLRGPNFGDVLMAEIVLRWIREVTDEPIRAVFVHPTLQKYLKLPKASFREIAGSHAVVMSGGGYFQIADGGLPAYKRFVKNAGPILLAQSFGKPSALLGTGVSDAPDALLEYGIKRLFKNASVACVRDRLGFDTISRIAPNSNTHEVADLVFTVGEDDLPQSAKSTASEIIGSDAGTQNIAILLSDTPERSAAYEPIFKAVEGAASQGQGRKFFLIEDHPSDGSGQRRAQKRLAATLGRDQSQIVPYPGTWALAALLGWMDGVLTDKLHVGLVAASLGTEPFSIAKHPKNLPAYQSLGLSSNCLLLGEAASTQCHQLVERCLASGRRLNLPDKVRSQARMNRQILNEFLSTTGLVVKVRVASETDA